ILVIGAFKWGVNTCHWGANQCRALVVPPVKPTAAPNKPMGAPSPAPPPTKDDSNPLEASTAASPTYLDVLSVQAFDGSVAVSPSTLKRLEIASADGLASTVQQIRAMFGLSEDKGMAVAHALAMLKVLETKFSDSKDVWALAAQKTKNWISSTLAAGGSKSLEECMNAIDLLVASVSVSRQDPLQGAVLS
ncbi:MAG TPA: hypothetical protein VEF04_18690, partial [Blastocatellia bacterium]|nr:hypothetical protein [Blastocatellia bacterium]